MKKYYRDERDFDPEAQKIFAGLTIVRRILWTFCLTLTFAGICVVVYDKFPTLPKLKMPLKFERVEPKNSTSDPVYRILSEQG